MHGCNLFLMKTGILTEDTKTVSSTILFDQSQKMSSSSNTSSYVVCAKNSSYSSIVPINILA